MWIEVAAEKRGNYLEPETVLKLEEGKEGRWEGRKEGKEGEVRFCLTH